MVIYYSSNKQPTQSDLELLPNSKIKDKSHIPLPIPRVMEWKKKKKKRLGSLTEDFGSTINHIWMVCSDPFIAGREERPASTFKKLKYI